ncbi:MAG: sigma-70 family RNA polymerase sigma factor [Candidatus Dormibacteraeota bacterium]|nr:sigma-70 family RNA polymerase sigma factor [Candidatus Dormibacteraeota bacterium]
MEAGLTRIDTAPGVLTAEELCRRYAPSVCRFAAMVAGSAADADDLAQDALLRAVRAVGSYDSAKGTPEAWLWRIVINSARDSARRRERARGLLERLMFAAPRESESVEAAVLARLRDEDLHAQIRLLPLRDRTLMALRFGAGLDTAEVGAAVGLSPDSAGKAIRRALARLRARLEVTR